MSDTSNTLVTLACFAGGLYFTHRWLNKDGAPPRAAEAPIGGPPIDAASPLAAPVSPPSPVDAPNGAGGAGYLSREFDGVFAQQGQGLPVAYLRALAWGASDLRPGLVKGDAWGLLQVEPVVLRDFNRRHGTTFRKADLLTETINVAVAADMLRLIIASYRRFHPDVPNLQEQWDNPRFVELLTAGYDAGFSERGGIGRVVGYLKKQGLTDITLDMVFAHAAAAGAVRHLAREEKVHFAKRVTRRFYRERSRPAGKV